MKLCLNHAYMILFLFLSMMQHAHSESIATIDQGHSWVSPFWGYNSPKIVSDGDTAYTVGLWGAEPNSSMGAIYQFSGGEWSKTATLADVYQPPTLALDAQQRLIVVHTQPGKAIAIRRSMQAGAATEFDELPAPPDMTSAYYVGIARFEDTLYLAYIDHLHSFYLASLNLEKLEWSPSVLITQGQQTTKPRTAWVYPILVPCKKGLHIALSNCPDGGSGNTYNQVRYLFFPKGTFTPSINEIVAETPMGHNTYATDMNVSASGEVHLAYMWKHRVYGDPLPESADPVGTYHAVRSPEGAWSKAQLSPLGIAGFHQHNDTLQVITQVYGKLQTQTWDSEVGLWSEAVPLIGDRVAPVSAGFIDVLNSSSGSIVSHSPLLVTDGFLPAVPETGQQRLLWSYGLEYAF